MKIIIQEWNSFIKEWMLNHLSGEDQYLKPDFFDFMQWLSRNSFLKDNPVARDCLSDN